MGRAQCDRSHQTRRQIAFKLDYSGGYGKYRRDYWKTFNNVCQAYDGPPLSWAVTACKSTDGSYWALQAWQRELPDLGLTPQPAQAVWELRLSHWTGDLPQLDIHMDWAYRRYDHLFGTLTYKNMPEFGFASTASGEPLDTFGRNIYVDTFDSAYGPGWRRENSFLAHTGSGAFCYGFYEHQNGSQRPAGGGFQVPSDRHRAGRHAGRDVGRDWRRGPYDASLDAQANDEIRALDDRQCKPNYKANRDRDRRALPVVPRQVVQQQIRPRLQHATNDFRPPGFSSTGVATGLTSA